MQQVSFVELLVLHVVQEGVYVGFELGWMST